MLAKCVTNESAEWVCKEQPFCIDRIFRKYVDRMASSCATSRAYQGCEQENGLPHYMCLKQECAGHPVPQILTHTQSTGRW